MTPDERALLDDLTTRARAGDASALGAMFGRLQPVLVRIAQREIGRSHAHLDADDLASDVMLRLIERFQAGQGPDDNPLAYLARAIRNRVIDVRRSAASRDVGSDDFVALADAYARIEDADEQRSVDVDGDLAVVRLAMSRLPRRQQVVLTAVAVEGMRPREIAASTGVAANTVSATASRARKALAVEVRRALLEAEGVDACEAHRDALATERPAASAALAHLEECARCRGALARFAALPSLLAIVPLAVLSGLVGETAAASAAGVAAPGAVGGRSEAHGADATPPGAAAAAAPASATAGRTGRRVGFAAAGLVLLAVLAVGFALLLQPDAVDSDGADADAPTATAEAGVDDADATATPSASADAEDADDAEGATGAPQTGASASPVGLGIDVAVGAGATTITVALDLEAGATVEGLLVALPSSMRIVDAGDWDCPSAAGGGMCTPVSQAPGSATIVVGSVDGAAAAGDATIEVAVVADGIRAEASSTGSIVVEP